MSTSMKAYLAEKYMSGPKADAIMQRVAGSKKKRRKLAADGDAGPSRIVDADEDALPVPINTAAELEDAVVETRDGMFKKRKAGDGWTTVRGAVKEESPPPAADELPLVVDAAPAPLTGGLITPAQFRKTLARPADPAGGRAEAARQAEETVYRDASGRRIDTKAERAEAARRRREAEELEARKMQWGKGLVQRDEEERLRQEEEKEKTRGMARYADDKDLNDMQKAQSRWNDPAAAFLTKNRTKGPRKPMYNGPTPAPNRFGIPPGYRWDGVDRGNGFEKKLFLRQNERKQKGAESHQWSVEDM